MWPTASMVFTTINDSDVLEGYFENFQRYGHLEQVQVFVIPDRKTPAATYKRCQEFSQRGLRVVCPTIEEQESFLRQLGLPANFIPYNSGNRRNVGYLMALESDSDFLISIDDDNYCRHYDDFFYEHSVVSSEHYLARKVAVDTGWFNVCDLLSFDNPGRIYARGFPYHARHKCEVKAVTSDLLTVRMNTGLWLQDPDVDGITWMVSPSRATSFKWENVVLDRNTWSPINTQNTALHRDVIAAYYFVRMDYPLAGMLIDRYDDIFSGYFSQACLHHMGHHVRIGTPIVDHKRNAHNYLRDTTDELAGLWILEDLTPWLIDVTIEGETYTESYISLSHALEDAVEQFTGSIWTDTTRGFFHQMAYCMRKWARACAMING